MSLVDGALGFLWRGGPNVDGVQAERLIAWRKLPPANLALPHVRARYVVVDTETTGLDMRSDRVIAIGAAAVSARLLPLSDCFATVLRQDKASATANILIHGIGGQVQLSGVEPKDGMLDFLDYVGKAPLVAFRAEFDRTMLTRALKSILGVPFHHPWIDLAFLLPALFRGTECNTLEDWLAHFGIAPAARHQALADAFATAQLLQIALHSADRQGMGNAGLLIAMQKAQHWLGKRH
jgi:DNA polymerase III subunit epsilon